MISTFPIGWMELAENIAIQITLAWAWTLSNGQETIEIGRTLINTWHWSAVQSLKLFEMFQIFSVPCLPWLKVALSSSAIS